MRRCFVERVRDAVAEQAFVDVAAVMYPRTRALRLAS
jgi:hypothetical protein